MRAQSGNMIKISQQIKFLAQQILKAWIYSQHLYPAYEERLQPIYAVMLLADSSSSTIQDTVYPERINYVYQIT